MRNFRYKVVPPLINVISDLPADDAPKNNKTEVAMQQQMEPVRPLDGMRGISREEVAKYFGRSGKGLNVRLDIPLLTVEDLKWTASVFSDLARDLAGMAYENERPDILRIMEGRYALYDAQARINDKNKKTKVRELNMKLRTGQKISAPTRPKKLSKNKGGGGNSLKTPPADAG